MRNRHNILNTIELCKKYGKKLLFLGRNKILNNSCIVIYGNTKSQDANIEWELKKAS